MSDFTNYSLYLVSHQENCAMIFKIPKLFTPKPIGRAGPGPIPKQRAAVRLKVKEYTITYLWWELQSSPT